MAAETLEFPPEDRLSSITRDHTHPGVCRGRRHCHVNEMSPPPSSSAPDFVWGRTTGTLSVSRSRAARRTDSAAYHDGLN